MYVHLLLSLLLSHLLPLIFLFLRLVPLLLVLLLLLLHLHVPLTLLNPVILLLPTHSPSVQNAVFDC